MPHRVKDFDYQRYLAGREWALLREQVRERSGDHCENCFMEPQQAVHHLTYKRIGHENLEDLMAVCNDCHEYFSGKSGWNNVESYNVVGERFEADFAGSKQWCHLIISLQDQPARLVRCGGEGCIRCPVADKDWLQFVVYELKNADRLEARIV